MLFMTQIAISCESHQKIAIAQHAHDRLLRCRKLGTDAAGTAQPIDEKPPDVKWVRGR